MLVRAAGDKGCHGLIAVQAALNAAAFRRHRRVKTMNSSADARDHARKRTGVYTMRLADMIPAQKRQLRRLLRALPSIVLVSKLESFCKDSRVREHLRRRHLRLPLIGGNNLF